MLQIERKLQKLRQLAFENRNKADIRYQLVVLGQELERRADSLEPEKYQELKEHLLALATVVGIGIVCFTANYTKDLNLLTNSARVEHVQPESRVNTTTTQSRRQIDSVQSESKVNTATTQPREPLNFDRQVDAIMHALIGQESSGRFDLVNTDSGALGYLQLMPSNVGPWSKEALGYPLSPQEFLQSPKLQLKIGRFKIAQYLREQSAPARTSEEVVRRVASLWYSGQAKLWNNTKPQRYGATSYPSIAEYTQSVWKKYRSKAGLHTPEFSLSSDLTQAKQGLDTNFWNRSLNTVKSRFQQLSQLKVVTESPSTAPTPVLSPQDIQARKIIAAMERKGYAIARGKNERNIVYLRSSFYATNSWDARRLVISFDDSGTPHIVFDAQATSYPGDQYIFHGRSDGAPFLKDGQYRAWKVGTHYGMTGTNVHEALVQELPLTVIRSHSHNFLQNGTPDKGIFGINLHGSRRTSDTIDAASAGCPVTRGMKPHQRFMNDFIKTDPRYLRDNGFIFSATFINIRDLDKR